MHLIDFLKNELNYTCEICNTEKYEKEITSEVFNYCFDCAKVVQTRRHMPCLFSFWQKKRTNV